MARRSSQGTIPELVTIADQSFVIAKLIQDCPAKAIIREIVQNAIEASRPGDLIEFREVLWGGVPKLALFNAGTGMTRAELSIRMNFASSGHVLGPDKNFGMGAKLAAGSASPYGLVYRSCCGGSIHQIWLQLQDGPDDKKQFVKLLQEDKGGTWSTVIDITESLCTYGYDNTEDWTEVLLLGHDALDNTLQSSFIGIATPQVNWLITAITQRYYDFPPGVSIENASVPAMRTHKERYNRRRARGLGDVLLQPAYTDELVRATLEHPLYGPCTLVYGHLTGREGDRHGGPWYAQGIGRPSHVCIVYKQEIYDFDDQWHYREGAYGFSGISADFYVHVLLSDDAPVFNSTYRTELLRRGDQHRNPLRCLDFGEMITEHRPTMVLLALEKFKRDRPDLGSLQARLAKLEERLQAREERPVVVRDEGTDAGVVEFDRREGPGGTEGPALNPKPKEQGRRTEDGFGLHTERFRAGTMQVYFRSKDNQQWHEEMQGKAGQFDSSAHTLWLNQDFLGYQQLLTWVNETWSAMEDNGLALSALDHEYKYVAGAHIVSARYFRKEWTPEGLADAMSPTALSAVLFDPMESMQQRLKQAINRLLNMPLRKARKEPTHAA